MTSSEFVHNMRAHVLWPQMLLKELSTSAIAVQTACHTAFVICFAAMTMSVHKSGLALVAASVDQVFDPRLGLAGSFEAQVCSRFAPHMQCRHYDIHEDGPVREHLCARLALLLCFA